MRKLTVIIVLALVAGIALPAHCESIIVNHSNWDWYTSQSQSVFDRVGQQKIFFSHASVGTNITGGMSALRSSNAIRYQLVVTGEDATPPDTTQPGRLYEYGRGNPGWQAKMDNFRTYVGNGWSSPKVDFSMDKLCYIDQNANVNTYITLMEGLMADNPDTKFILWTMPLTTSTGSDNVLRNQYNMAVRNYAATHDVILFDIADIESWSPSGVQQTFVYGSVTYQMLYSGYTGDGGHLNSDGAQRVANGLYSLFGLATEPSPVPVPAALWLFGSGLLGLIGIRRTVSK